MRALTTQPFTPEPFDSNCVHNLTTIVILQIGCRARTIYQPGIPSNLAGQLENDHEVASGPSLCPQITRNSGWKLLLDIGRTTFTLRPAERAASRCMIHVDGSTRSSKITANTDTFKSGGKIVTGLYRH